MKFDLRSRSLTVTPALREHAERRIAFALGRFGRKIKALTVSLADVNGPRGGKDKTCVIKIDAGRGSVVIVKERHHNIFAAAALAAARAGRAVQRKLGSLAAPRRVHPIVRV